MGTGFASTVMPLLVTGLQGEWLGCTNVIPGAIMEWVAK